MPAAVAASGVVSMAFIVVLAIYSSSGDLAAGSDRTWSSAWSALPHRHFRCASSAPSRPRHRRRDAPRGSSPRSCSTSRPRIWWPDRRRRDSLIAAIRAAAGSSASRGTAGAEPGSGRPAGRRRRRGFRRPSCSARVRPDRVSSVGRDRPAATVDGRVISSRSCGAPMFIACGETPTNRAISALDMPGRLSTIRRQTN